MSASPVGSPILSVVMPLFNAERHVAAAARSVLDSTLRDIELLVVDDGSTDGSVVQIQTINDPRLHLISLSPSGGPSRPRNTGITRARAPYVALLDADDLLKPHKLGDAVEALATHPEAGIAFADYERIDADGRVLSESVLTEYPVFRSLPSRSLRDGWHQIPQVHFIRGLLHENFIGTSGVVLRRSVLEEVGMFDETLTYSEDRDLWFRIAHAYDALYQARIGHSYRVSATSLTFRPGERQARQRIETLRRERRRWSSRAEKRQVDRLIAENFNALGYERRRVGRRVAGAAAFLQAIRHSAQLRFLRAAIGSLVLGPRAANSQR